MISRSLGLGFGYETPFGQRGIFSNIGPYPEKWRVMTKPKACPPLVIAAKTRGSVQPLETRER